jgi:hypothetical protein
MLFSGKPKISQLQQVNIVLIERSGVRHSLKQHNYAAQFYKKIMATTQIRKAQFAALQSLLITAAESWRRSSSLSELCNFQQQRFKNKLLF